MSSNSFMKQKVENYSGSIPSRELIITHLAQKKRAVSSADIASELDIYTEDQFKGLQRRLRAMERDGQLICTNRQLYILPESVNLLRGTVIGHRDGFGFLRIDGSKDDYYLSFEQMRIAIHGDVVIAHYHGVDRKGKREARILRVLCTKKLRKIVGRLLINAGNTFVVPTDNRFSFNIHIPKHSDHGASNGSLVVVELIQRPTYRTIAIGKIVEILGDTMGTNMVVNIALRIHDIPYVWPIEVEQQISSFKSEVPEEAKIGRIDLRTLPLITIDDEEARDFDDAVYCETKHDGGWRLWVAIADVSYYVRPDTPLDKEASHRSNSVYFPLQVIPMLPEVLSNGLCSLNPKVDRLCLVCEMTISAQGSLSSYNFYEAVMNSHARLTYNKVWQIINGNQKIQNDYHSLIRTINNLHDMYKKLEQKKQNRGGISFEKEETKFIFNSNYRIERIESVIRNDAHKLIEECMILANMAAANFVEKNKEPVLYRVHDKPSNEHITSLRIVLGELGLTLGGGDIPSPNDYNDLLNLVAGRQDYEMLHTMILRSMKQAIYDTNNRGHFGLALKAYTHFTSPIRRYPDLLLHRAIKYLLGKQNGDGKCTGGWHCEIDKLIQLGQQCTLRERRADEATRDVADWLKCDFMQDYVGEVFSGIIVSVTNFGFFVRINELLIDGLVHISSLTNDYYRFDNIGQRLIGDSRGNIYQLGNIVKICVIAVHMDDRKIEFSLISNHTNYRKNCRIKNSIERNY